MKTCPYSASVYTWPAQLPSLPGLHDGAGLQSFTLKNMAAGGKILSYTIHYKLKLVDYPKEHSNVRKC